MLVLIVNRFIGPARHPSLAADRGGRTGLTELFGVRVAEYDSSPQRARAVHAVANVPQSTRLAHAILGVERYLRHDQETGGIG
jgi:hypothetical protein